MLPASLVRPILARATLAPSLVSLHQPQVRRRSEMITCFRLCDGAIVARDTAIAAEVPVALAYNGVSHVVMMATPCNLADFALGFSVSEGILADPTELLDLRIEEGQTGIRISMTITRERFAGNKETGAVHAAAWATPTGKITLVREDVGRHNALDKLIGAMGQGRIDPEAGFA